MSKKRKKPRPSPKLGPVFVNAYPPEVSYWASVWRIR